MPVIVVLAAASAAEVWVDVEGSDRARAVVEELGGASATNALPAPLWRAEGGTLASHPREPACQGALLLPLSAPCAARPPDAPAWAGSDPTAVAEALMVLNDSSLVDYQGWAERAIRATPTDRVRALGERLWFAQAMAGAREQGLTQWRAWGLECADLRNRYQSSALHERCDQLPAPAPRGVVVDSPVPVYVDGAEQLRVAPGWHVVQAGDAGAWLRVEPGAGDLRLVVEQDPDWTALLTGPARDDAVGALETHLGDAVGFLTVGDAAFVRREGGWRSLSLPDPVLRRKAAVQVGAGLSALAVGGVGSALFEAQRRRLSSEWTTAIEADAEWSELQGVKRRYVPVVAGEVLAVSASLAGAVLTFRGTLDAMRASAWRRENAKLR